MEGRSKWRGRDPAEEKKSSSDEVRHCCFLTCSARSAKSSRCVPSLEGRGREVDVGEREGRGRGEGGEGGGKSTIPSALVEGGEHVSACGLWREDVPRPRLIFWAGPGDEANVSVRGLWREDAMSSLSVNGYCRDLHICKTLGLLVASLSELPRT